MTTFKVPIGISNRHVHLAREDVEALFGPGHELTWTKDLSQPGQFACAEMVTLVGPKGSLEGVRILGPEREVTQVELATTDSFKLGLKPPLRDSGELEGTPGLDIIGPYGTIHPKSGVIIAARHIHMIPEDAQKYQLKTGDIVRVVIPGSRGGIWERVHIKVHQNFALDLHVDTDEGNSFWVENGQIVDVLVEKELSQNIPCKNK